MQKRHRLAAGIAVAALPMLPAIAAADTTLTVATVNNVQMIEMEKLTPQFEKLHPDIHVRYVTLEENVLRQRVTTDIATHGGQFDLLTIGNYEVPIWAKQGWARADERPARLLRRGRHHQDRPGGYQLQGHRLRAAVLTARAR